MWGFRYRAYGILALLAGVFSVVPLAAYADDVIKIHLISPFSGPVAFYGEGYQQGLELALAQAGGAVKGHKLEVVRVDDECKPEAAVNQVNKLDASAVVTVGPACSGNMLAVQKTLEEAGIPHVFTGYGAAITQKGDKLVYRASLSDGAMAQGLITWANKKFGTKTWAIIHDTTGYGAGGAATFKTAAEGQGMKVATEASYNPGERDFNGILLNVDNAKADGLHLVGYEVELGLLVKQAKQIGIKTRIFGPPAFVNSEFVQAAGDAANGLNFVSIILPDDPTPGVQAFVKQFKAKYSSDPKDVNAIGFVAGRMIIEAIARIDGPVNRQTLAAALAKTDIGDSPLGPIKLDANGERTGSGLAVIGEIKDGKPTFVTRQ